MARSVSFSRVVAAAFCLTVLVVGGKGVMLWSLSKSIDARAADIAAFYKTNVQQYVTQLQTTPGLTAPEKDSLTTLAASAPGQGSTREEYIGSIVTVQKGFLEVLGAMTTAGMLAKQPQLLLLQTAFSRDGGVQPLLDIYNQQAREWNLQRVTGLGAVYAKLFGLGPRLLLQADGTAEYDTTVTL